MILVWLLFPNTVSCLPFKKNYLIGDVVVILLTIFAFEIVYNYSKDFKASIAWGDTYLHGCIN